MATALTQTAAPKLLLLGASVAVGLGASLGLAWFMYTLIHGSEMQLSEVTRNQILDFVRVKRSEVIERKNRKPQRPPTSRAPDAPPTPQQAEASAGQVLSVSAPPAVSTDLGLSSDGTGIGTGDGEYLPIVKVAPVYPRNALSRRLTGECMVRYTVTTSGTVKDISVMEDYCTDQIFYRPSIDAAKRFKYKPRVIDGVAVEVRGVQNVFYYDIEKEEGQAQQ